MKKSSKEKKEVKKEKTSKNQIIVFSIIGFLLLSITAGIIYLKVKDSDPLNVKNPYDYLVFDEENNAFFNKVSETFEVNVVPKKKFSYKVVDSEGKEVDTVIEKKSKYSVIKPKNKYKRGEVYTLSIAEGTFENEELKDVSKIEFKVVREQVEKVVYNNNVKEAKEKDVTITNDVLATDEKYKVGDIILVDNREAYKITNINDDKTYQVTIPEIQEVYKELDVYIDEPIKLNDFVVSSDLEEYIAYNVSKSKWYENIVQTVNAAPKIKVEINTSKTGVLDVKVAVRLSPGEKGAAIPALKNHGLNFNLEFEIEVYGWADLKLTYHDVQITLRLKDTVDFSIDFIKAELDNFGEEKTGILKDFGKLVEYQALIEEVKTDKANVVSPVGWAEVPIGSTGLFFNFDIGMLFEYEMTLDAGFEITNEKTMNIGYKWNVIDGFEPIGNMKSKSYDKKAYLGGKAEFKLGSEIKAGVSLLNLAELNLGLDSGAYGESELKLKAEPTSQNPTYEIFASGEAGLFVEAKLAAEVFGNTAAEWVFYENKFKIIETKEKNGWCAVILTI